MKPVKSRRHITTAIIRASMQGSNQFKKLVGSSCDFNRTNLQAIAD